VANFIAIGIFTGFIYAMLALGYTLVYGVLRLINFAHSEVMMSGAFASYFLFRVTISDVTPPNGIVSVWWILAGIALSGVVGSIIAILLERFAYRPLRRRNAPALTYLITAIGASYFLQFFAGKEFGYYQESVNPPFSNNIVWSPFGAQITTYDILVGIVAIVLMLFLDAVVNRTKMGRGIRALAQDQPTASLMGVNVNRTISQTFALGGFLGGAAGFLFALQNGVSFSMGFQPGLLAFTAAVLGGIGNIRGAVLGGLTLGLVETVPLYWLQDVWLQPVIGFVVLVLVLLFRPTGILGENLGRTA
jgi:branched-chain amino acid transport system permease protein